MITDPTERDLIIRTVIGEAAQEGPVGQLAVAHVIANRMNSAGRGARDIIMARHQFEPWNNPRAAAQLQSISPSDPRYQRVAQALEPFFQGQSQDPTGGATHFYSPTAQASLGRQPPAWDNGSGQDIGRHRFFALGYAPSQANSTAGIPFPGGTQPTAQPNSAFWNEAGRLTAGISWDDLPDAQPEAQQTPAAPVPVAPAPVASAEKPVEAAAIQWDDAPPAGLVAPALPPRPDAAPLGSPDMASTFAAVAPQPQGAPLAAPNLDEAFANFQGGLPTQGNAVAAQRSIPEITVRPPGAQTTRQRAQLAAEQELDRAGPVAGGANAIVQGLARGVNPFMDDTAAFLNTITGQGQGNSFSERYQANLDAQRGVNAAFDSRNPILSFGGQLAGATALPVGQMAAPANAMVRFGRGAGVGAGYGAAFGFGQGDGLEDRIQKAGTGALVGGAVGGPLNALIGPRIPQAAVPSQRPTGPDVVAAAGRQGIDVPRLIASDSMAVQRVGQGVRNVPLAGNPIVRNTDRMVQQMGQRADEVAAGLGGGNVPSRDAAGAAARSAIEETVSTTMPARANQLYSRVDQLMPPGQAFPLFNTAQMAQTLNARSQGAAMGESAAANLVNEAINRPGGLTFEGMRALRTRIREMTSYGNTPQGTSNGELKQIVTALSRDIDAAVSTASPQAQRAYQQANQWYEAWAQRRETLGRILNANSDEAIVNQIQNAASSRASGDIWKLATARKSMPAEEWGQIASEVVSRLGRDQEGNFSAQRFAADYGKLSERGKDLLFRANGNRSHAQALDDLATISSRFREIQRFANPSGTGQSIATLATGAGAITDPLTTIGGIIGGNVLSRVLAAPATASSAARWSKAYELAVKQPTAASLSALQIASRNFAATLGEKAGITVDPNNLFRALPYQRLGQSDEDRNDVPSGRQAAP